MGLLNVSNWQNETGLSGYPFEFESDLRDFIVDASFVQFDNFTPVLNNVMVEGNSIKMAITFDTEQLTNLSFTKQAYDMGPAYRSLRIRTNAGRYLGCLTFGSGLEELWRSYTGRLLTLEQPFLQSTVKSIPLKDGVYLLDSNYGAVNLSRAVSDKTIFYNVSTENNSITFNAVTGHAVSGTVVREGLRKINMVAPNGNNINLASNDIIKITPFNAASLRVDLVSGAVSQEFVIPSLTT
jgi:hypothetical protein